MAQHLFGVRTSLVKMVLGEPTMVLQNRDTGLSHYDEFECAC